MRRPSLTAVLTPAVLVLLTALAACTPTGDDEPETGAPAESIESAEGAPPPATGAATPAGESTPPHPSGLAALTPPGGPNHALADLFPPEQAAGSMLDLAWRLYPALAEDANFVFSPFVISTGLASVVSAAEGQTAEELAVALRFPPDRVLLPKGFSIVTGAVPTDPSPERAGFLAANALWGRRGLAFTTDFLTRARDDYGVQASVLDFSTPGQAGNAIAAWTTSHAGIPFPILPPALLDREDVLALTGQAAFRGHWLHPFIPRQSGVKPFWVTPDDSVGVPMMRTVDAMRYTWNWVVDVVEIPYVGAQLDLVAFLPRDRDGLPQVEAWLPDSLDAWLSRLEERHVDLMLPRVRIESGFALTGMFRALGAERVFDPNLAELGDMVEEGGAALTTAHHGASFDLNEQGSGVADTSPHAAERLQGVRSNLFVFFHADHPFAFLLRDRAYGTPLLVGRFTKPPGE